MKKKLALAALLVCSASAVQAQRMVTILEFDDKPVTTATPVMNTGPQLNGENVVASKTFSADGLFQFNKSSIQSLHHNESDFSELASIAKSGNYYVRIDAFADEIGTDAYNLRLSKARAKSVAQHFTKMYGIPLSKITYQGWGENYPVVNCQISAKLMKDKISKKQIIDCLAPNRRVTISVIK